MNSAQIRETFLKFFECHQHQRVDSGSLIPGNDPSLLFTNAGMVPFKDVFLGLEQRPYQRACSAQRCVRAGGKHNDLENVGYTARHHTFFEMLGNFSFGDYFKRQAIEYAWQFLTQELGLPEEKLWVTVHVDDKEAEDIWLNEVGVSTQRFSRLDEDNFWQMGDTGPCGPSSEIFYDHGAAIAGDPPGGDNDDGDRYIEIWNLVFMQFERQSDGQLQPLPNPSIDTGMGLERIAAVMQGVHNNYEIDLFQALLAAAAKLCGVDDTQHQSLRVIADHIRSCSFLIVDGVLPGNEGRAYVLRRIIRRAIRHGHKLGITEPFFHRLVPALVEQMGTAYPELVEAQQHVMNTLLAEEQQFAQTLNLGIQVLERTIEQLSGTVIPGDIIFKLYDSHGFPVDLTNDIAREHGLTLDLVGYEHAMEQQRARSQASAQFQVDYSQIMDVQGTVEFSGYELLDDEARVLQIIVDGNEHNSIDLSSIDEHQNLCLVLDKTPFYAESGGQVGDTGLITNQRFSFEVNNTTQKGAQHLHWGQIKKGHISCNDVVKAQVNIQHRQAVSLNHSATHLLHAALREVLGTHVQQKGSLVDAQRLRFDFSHHSALNAQQIEQIEHMVNSYIRQNSPVHTVTTTMKEAQAMGALALFGEKYADEVRVLSMGQKGSQQAFSVELCGGTHVSRTGDIAMLTIETESGVASGVRRIEAQTGVTALRAAQQWRAQLDSLSTILKTPRDRIQEKIAQQLVVFKEQEKQLQALKQRLAAAAGADLVSQAKVVNGVKVLVAELESVERKVLLSTLDELKAKLERAVIFLVSKNADQLSLVAGVSSSLTPQFKAGDLMREMSGLLGGKGGGRADMAQGAAEYCEHLTETLNQVYQWVEVQQKK